MRSALAEVDGVQDIETDAKTRTCSFKVNLDEVNIQETLANLGETNSHIKGWSVKNQKPL